MTVESRLPAPEAGSRRRRRHHLQRVVLASVLTDIQFWMIQPLVALTLTTQGYSPATVGFVASVPWLVATVTAPAMPWLVGWFGPVRVLRLSIAVSGLAVWGLASFDELPFWIAANAGLGLGFGLCWVVSDSWVSAAGVEGRRGRLLGLYETIASSTIGVGALLLTVVIAWDWSPFAMCGALLVLSAAATLGLTATQSLLVSQARIHTVFRTVARSPVIILCAFLCGLIEEGGVALLPVHVVGIGFDAKTAALVVTAFGLGHLFLQYPVGICCDKFGHRFVQGAILCVLFVGFVAAPLASSTEAALLCFVLVGGGLTGALYTTCMVEASVALRGSGLVGAITAMMAVNTLGSMVGPAFGGIGMSVNPTYGLFAVFALAVLGVGVGIVLLSGLRAIKQTGRGRLVLQER